jgi:hypothetical protein
MTYTIELDRCHSMMKQLARDIKTRYSVGDNEIIWPHITKEHGITVNYKNLLRDNSPPTTVTFSSEAQYILLMLKYL